MHHQQHQDVGGSRQGSESLQGRTSWPWLNGKARLLQSFFDDFAHVADDEGRHLGWCLQRLEELGFAYGDMPAHNVLWEGAQKSAGTFPLRKVLHFNFHQVRNFQLFPPASGRSQCN